MRQDEKRRLKNLKIKKVYRETVKAVRQRPTKESLKKACSALDKAEKKGVIKKSKASRLKSRLSRLTRKK